MKKSLALWEEMGRMILSRSSLVSNAVSKICYTYDKHVSKCDKHVYKITQFPIGKFWGKTIYCLFHIEFMDMDLTHKHNILPLFVSNPDASTKCVSDLTWLYLSFRCHILA
jgi:hypothetical protein